jgi:hypothetical protein
MAAVPKGIGSGIEQSFGPCIPPSLEWLEQTNQFWLVEE